VYEARLSTAEWPDWSVDDVVDAHSSDQRVGQHHDIMGPMARHVSSDQQRVVGRDRQTARSSACLLHTNNTDDDDADSALFAARPSTGPSRINLLLMPNLLCSPPALR